MARLKHLEEEFNLVEYKRLYPDVDSIMGIYSQTNRTKHRIIILVKLVDGTRKTCSYPRALFETHIGRKLDFPNETVDHINNDPMDNRIGNLQLLSLVENALKAHRDGIAYRPPKGIRINFDASGANNGQSKISEEDVLKYRRQYTAGRSKREIIQEIGLCRRTVENFLYGVSYTKVPEICERRREKYTKQI